MSDDRFIWAEPTCDGFGNDPGSSLSERIAKAARLAAPVFKRNRWTWGGVYDLEWGKCGSPLHVPSSEEIAQSIHALYRSALSESGSSASGRLHVVRDDDDGSVELWMQLAVLRDAVAGWESPGRTTSAERSPASASEIDRAAAPDLSEPRAAAQKEPS